MPPVENLGRRWISHVDAVLVGATAAWLIFCAAYHFRELDGFDGGMRTALGWTVGAAMIVRLGTYLLGYPPPISLFGRIATGRLIIPKYDVVFIAPLTAAMTAWLVALTAARIGVAPLIATPIACGIAIWLSLALPPRYVAWVYTGGHRVAYRFRAWLLDRSKSANSALERERGS